MILPDLRQDHVRLHQKIGIRTPWLARAMFYKKSGITVADLTAATGLSAGSGICNRGRQSERRPVHPSDRAPRGGAYAASAYSIDWKGKQQVSPLGFIGSSNTVSGARDANPMITPTADF